MVAAGLISGSLVGQYAPQKGMAGHDKPLLGTGRVW